MTLIITMLSFFVLPKAVGGVYELGQHVSYTISIFILDSHL
jgi:hypothetical protein